MRCPHTMKATDGDGNTYCCDCGKVLRRALSEAALAARMPPPPWVLLDQRNDCVTFPTKARVTRVARRPR